MTGADLRYPIGEFRLEGSISSAARAATIEALGKAPTGFRAAVAGLDDLQLDTPYRPGGWTVRQVIHHLADSHQNAAIRVRLALTEDHPTVKTYDEAAWARLADYALPVAASLGLLDRLHERWVVVLRATAPSDFARTCFHPGVERTVSVDWLVAFYAWHGAHHTAHITELRRRQGW